MMNHQNAIDEIHALVANSEVNDAVAEKLLPIAYWLEAEIEDKAASNHGHPLRPTTGTRIRN